MDSEKMIETIFNVGSNVTSGGVLLFIAYFLYHNVPKWIDRHFDVIAKISADHKEEIKETAERFSEELREEREACERNNERIADVIERSNAAHLKGYETVTQSIAAHHLFAVQRSLEIDNAIKLRNQNEQKSA